VQEPTFRCRTLARERVDKEVFTIDLITAIENRRSVRRFKSDPVARQTIERILQLASKAPSGKNSQPWSFVVLEGEAKSQMSDIFSQSVEDLKSQGLEIGSAANSARITRQAPVVVLVYDRYVHRDDPPEEYAHYTSLSHTQSIGAAIQTLLLAALDAGLGSLWICDIFMADTPINQWLGRTDELVAAVALGYADEMPAARPRLPLSELVTWME
jgi:nitroreductase